MIDMDSFLGRPIGSVFLIAEIEITDQAIDDALGREAIAKTRIVGRAFRLTIRSGLTETEMSITLYHEILEAATVAAVHPPESVCELNEAGFETAAKEAHQSWGNASVENLNRMLQFYGFHEE